MTPEQIQRLRELVSSPHNERYGWCLPTDRHWLRGTIRALPSNAVIVEIGTYRAKSAAEILLACQGSCRRVYTIDPFVDYRHHSGVAASQHFHVDFEKLYEETRRFLEDLPITLLRCTSEQAAHGWRNGLIDLVWIDGNHTEDAVYKDLVSWFPLVRRGGILSGHDWALPSVQAGVSKFLKDKPCKLKISYHLWWFYKGEACEDSSYR